MIVELLTAVPVISPVEVRLAAHPGAGGISLLPPAGGGLAALTAGAQPEPAGEPDDSSDADYTVLDTDPELAVAGVGLRALDEIEAAARVSEYHDFTWWRIRIEEIRAAISTQ